MGENVSEERHDPMATISIHFTGLEDNFEIVQSLREQGYSDEEILKVISERSDNSEEKPQGLEYIQPSKVTQAEIEDAKAMLLEPTRNFMKGLQEIGLYNDTMLAMGLDPKEHPPEMWDKEV